MYTWDLYRVVQKTDGLGPYGSTTEEEGPEHSARNCFRQRYHMMDLRPQWATIPKGGDTVNMTSPLSD